MARYDVDVKLTGEDGNAFFIMAKVQGALRKANATEQEIDEYFDEATAGDYHHLLATTMKWVNVQ